MNKDLESASAADRQFALDLVLRAAKYVGNRTSVKARDLRAALGLNNTQPAHFYADRAMRAGGFTRRNGEYRRTPDGASATGDRP